MDESNAVHKHHYETRFCDLRKTLARVVPNSLSVDGTYLLNDFVHLIKNIRILWITEKTGELKFRHENKFLVAKWHHLRTICSNLRLVMCWWPQLSDRSSCIFKIHWTTACKYLSPFFCEETATALEHYGRQHCIDVTGTVTFIRKVLKWWTIMNGKNKVMDLRNCHPLQAVISHPDDPRLQFLEEFEKMCLNMSGKQGKREQKLSKDTVVAPFRTCCGIL